MMVIARPVLPDSGHADDHTVCGEVSVLDVHRLKYM
jgi:hypothetical protein